MIDYQTLRNKFSLEQQDFCRYLQIHDYFNKCNRNHPTDLEDAILNKFLRSYSNKPIKGAISRLYKGPEIKKKANSTDHITHKWEKEGHREITARRLAQVLGTTLEMH